MPRFICHRQRSATSPLRYLSVYVKLRLEQNKLFNFYRTGRPVMPCCGTRINHRIRGCLISSTAATPYASLHLPPAALGNVPTSIRLRICRAFFKPCNLLSFFDACASRYILLRCPKFLKRISAKISTAATPYASLLLPLAALGNVPTSHTTPEDRQARLSGVGCRYHRRRRYNSP